MLGALIVMSFEVFGKESPYAYMDRLALEGGEVTQFEAILLAMEILFRGANYTVYEAFDFNANLAFFSWLGFCCAVHLIVSLVRLAAKKVRSISDPHEEESEQTVAATPTTTTEVAGTGVDTAGGDKMAIPKYIRNKMHSIAALHAQASELMGQVEDYLAKHGYDIEEIRDGSGASLEELDYGNDVTEELCQRLEEGFGLAQAGGL